MNQRKSALLALAFGLLLIASMAFTGTTMAANPVYPEFKATYTYVVTSPNPIGVNQEALFVFWLDQPPPNAHGAYGDRWKFTIEVTKPDGTKQSLGTVTSDPVGGGWLSYTPDTVGTYYFQASFVGGWINITGTEWYIPSGQREMTPGDYYYKPSTSEKAPLTVQLDPIQGWQGAALPTSFWTRPIDAGLREWHQVGGNWLADGRQPLYTTGPETAHIVWTKQLDFGGIVGGEYGDTSYYTGSSYESKWNPPVIMQGRLYYNVPLSDKVYTSRDLTVAERQGVACVDLQTGEELWVTYGTCISIGQLYNYDTGNQHGVIPYLIAPLGTTWRFYDPFSGNWLYNITNVPSGTQAVGPNGEALIYQLNYAKRWLALWNNTAIPQLLLSLTSGTDMWQWRPVGKVGDGTKAYSWNVTIPNLNGLSSPSILTVLEDRIIGTSGMTVLGGRYATTNPWTLWAISLKPASRGQLLWIKNYTAPPGNQTIQYRGASLEDGVIVINNKELMTYYGYDINTGELLWGPTQPLGPYAMYGMSGQFAYGKFYSNGQYDGALRAYEAKTGKLLWNFTTGNCGLESVYPNWPSGSGAGMTVADGKIYLTTYEHSTTMPLYRGWSIYCIDADTGKGIWNITALMPTPAIADGYMVALNGMDNQIYCFGKGPTVTSVSSSPEVSVHGSSVLLTGMVTDNSAGTRAYANSARYPHGVPAIADEYMTEWMEHIYKQQSCPAYAKGVEVTLDTIDPNGNFVHIGTATTDMGGSYGYAFVPEVPGLYQIIATFAGSKSYWTSYAQTYINVEEAPPATAAPEYPQPIDNTMTIIGVGIAIMILVAIFGVLILRKK